MISTCCVVCVCVVFLLLLNYLNSLRDVTLDYHFRFIDRHNDDSLNISYARIKLPIRNPYMYDVCVCAFDI